MQMLFESLASRIAPYVGDMPQASKADRQRAHSERVRIVEASQRAVQQLRGTAPQRVTPSPVVSAARPTSRTAEQARLNKELRQAVADRETYRAQVKAKADASAINYERNPSKIRQEHESESRRLAKLQREIEAEIRQAAWNHR